MFNDSKIFKDLSNDEKNQLEIFCQEKNIKKNERLFKEGDEANSMYILKKGIIKIHKNISGEDTFLGSIEAEDILGEMAIFGDKGKRMATATVEEDSTLITILSFSIKELTNKHPEILDKIKEIIEIRNIQNKRTN